MRPIDILFPAPALGDTFAPDEDHDLWGAGIDLGRHLSAIEVFGESEAIVRARRDALFQVLRAAMLSEP